MTLSHLYWGDKRRQSNSPVLGDRGEAEAGLKAVLVQSEREPRGDDPMWSGATAPSSTQDGGRTV